MAITTYGDITPRTAAFAVAQLLKRALPYLVLEKWGQAYPIPTNSTKVAKFRRYESLPLATTPLTEGVTPAGNNVTVTDYTATLSQYGSFVAITDVIMDTHEDPVLQQYIEIIGEQAAQTIEAIRFNILKAGTNVFYSNGSARTDITTAYALTLQQKITRSFKRQNVPYITKQTASTPNWGTSPTKAGYIGYIHPDLEIGIRGLSGFIDAVNYASQVPADTYEIGAVQDVRYIRSTVAQSWPDGGSAKGSMISTSGINCDVYPILFFGADAYGLVPLKGKDSITPMVKNPNNPVQGDELGQRGFVSWKVLTTAVILNQLRMARAEVACLEL
jgi:N4-gp56 family major capsid protein